MNVILVIYNPCNLPYPHQEKLTVLYKYSKPECIKITVIKYKFQTDKNMTG